MPTSNIHMARSRILIIAAFLASFILVTQAQEQKTKYTPKDLPAAVLTSFQKEYPKASIKGVSMEKEKGVTFWEIESIDGKVTRDLLYSVDGKKAETEETIEMAQVPAIVRTTLTAEYPKGKVEKAEKLTKGNVVTFEFQVKDASTEHEVVVASDGKLLKGGKAAKSEKEEDEEEEEDEDD
jgi:hypothetical protein